MQHAMGVHDIEVRRGKFSIEDAALDDLLVWQAAELKADASAFYRLTRDIQATPDCSTVNQLLAISALPEPDFQHALAAEVDLIKTRQNVAFFVIAVLVVLPE